MIVEMTETLERLAAHFGLHADDYRAAVGRARVYERDGRWQLAFDMDDLGSMDRLDVCVFSDVPYVVDLALPGSDGECPVTPEPHVAQRNAWDLLVAADLIRLKLLPGQALAAADDGGEG